MNPDRIHSTTQEHGSAERIQYLSIAAARYVFSHPEHGLVFTHQSVRLAEIQDFGLSPLILITLAVPGTAVQWFDLRAPNALGNLAELLSNTWRTITQLRGYPDKLLVSQHIAGACPGLEVQLARLGVTMQVAEPNDKRYGAAIRSAQDQVLQIPSPSKSEPPCETLEQFEYAVARKLHFAQAYLYHQLTPRARAESTAQHLARPFRSLPDIDLCETPLTIGPWAFGWESNVPPSTTRKALANDCGQVWLNAIPEGDVEAAHGSKECLADHEGSLRSLFKIMIACWPNSPKEVAEALGVSLREFNWYLRGSAELDVHQCSRLKLLLGVEWSESFLDYQLQGACVVIARNVGSIRKAYNELSLGGNVSVSVELVPDDGPADPHWRYVYLEPWGELASVIMVARDGPVADNLDSKHFFKFQGCRQVPRRLYLQLLTACAGACASPLTNRREMLNFFRQNVHVLQELFPPRF